MMTDMAREHEETVNLYIRRDIRRLCIAQAESPRALRHVVNVGDEFPLWAGASAKVLLADVATSLLARVVAGAPAGRGDLAAPAGRQSRRPSAAGFAVSHGERESGVSAVAVPVLDDTGRVVAALSMSGATARFTDERDRRLRLRTAERRRRHVRARRWAPPSGARSHEHPRLAPHARARGGRGATGRRTGPRSHQRPGGALLQLPADAARRGGHQGGGPRAR